MLQKAKHPLRTKNCCSFSICVVWSGN